MVSNSLRKSSNISVSLYWLGYEMKIQSKLLAECKICRYGRSIFFWFILETSIRERFGCWKSLQRSLMSHLLKVSKWIFFYAKVQPWFFLQNWKWLGGDCLLLPIFSWKYPLCQQHQLRTQFLNIYIDILAAVLIWWL